MVADVLAAASPETRAADADKALLRFLTCGSVDDGKSTLIGRLLYDSQAILADQMAMLERESRRFGTTGEEIDLALLLDGLDDERQQGITIDVAYRFFATPRRSFIVADSPGHEQYTRNMATGASTADLALLLVDARKGVVAQTRRHSLICSLLGIQHVVLAINKLDLVEFNEAVFSAIADDYRRFAGDFGFATLQAIPISARYGDNVARPSPRTAWYSGPPLLDYLETVNVNGRNADAGFRFPAQWINRPNADFRGVAGTVAAGSIAPGDPIVVTGTGVTATIKDIVTFDGTLGRAAPGDAVTLTFTDEIDVTRGDLLTSPDARATFADQFAAHVIWMKDEPLVPGRSYWLKLGAQTAPASVTAIKHRIDINTGAHIAARALALNEIGFCNLSVARPIAFDPYKVNRDTGGFILIDRASNDTAGAGMIEFGLHRATNIHVQALTVGPDDRAALKAQRAAVVWLTGLSGAGKSTIANGFEKKLLGMGAHSMLLDGDNVRHGLNRDLGFTDADRVENIRRLGEVAKLMADAGLIVVTAFISPFRADRQMAREIVAPHPFIEVFVDTPLDECIRRDPKGLYARAMAGAIPNFTGLDSPYEAPENPELRLPTVGQEIGPLADTLIEALRERGIVG
ncbi:MAG TPA: sulfate adenylyltransferase subunit CysN [Stellaceae bacterium]|nr:sulfate adenylyltransferase subunit CysN [Stellaceae bacterium]